jgi:hypothetical protein
MNEQEQQDLNEQFKIKLCHYERFRLCTKSFLTWFSVHIVFPRPCVDITEPEALKSL